MSAAPSPVPGALAPGAIAPGVVARDVLLGEDGLAFLTGLIEGRHPPPPFAATMGLRLVEVGPGLAVFEGEAGAAFLNPIGTVHGGWTAAIMDSAMACAVHSALKAGEAYTTLEYRIHCTRAVMPGDRLRCEGRVVTRGARVATSEARLTDAAGRVVAHGTETCLVMPAP